MQSNVQPIFPPALKMGDTIGVVAPSGPVKRERIDLALERLQQAGFRIKTYGNLLRKRGYLAGDDPTRAQELMEAFTDPETQAVFPARGGYGVARLLDRLDYALIRQRPKIVNGFSDITALHIALQRHCHLVTFHSPNLMDGLGATKGLGDFSEWSYWRAIRADCYQESPEKGYQLMEPNSNIKLEAMNPGKAQGRITGGNLALIASTLGTPYEIDTAGCLLFLEDVGEQPYRIDRYLAQLKLAGKLNGAVGILIGHFTDCQASQGNASLNINDILHDYFSPLNVPVVRNFPAGHEKPNVTIPLGVLAQLDANLGVFELLENPVVWD